jgi:hypothetical protein
MLHHWNGVPRTIWLQTAKGIFDGTRLRITARNVDDANCRKWQFLGAFQG